MTLYELINSNSSLAQAVSDGNDGAIQNWLNTPSVVSSRKIPVNDFVACLYDTGAFTAIKHATAQGNETAAFAIDVLRDSKALGIENIDLSLDVNQDLLNALLTEGVLTQAQVDAVAELSMTLVSPAEANGFGAVSIEQIAKALRG